MSGPSEKGITKQQLSDKLKDLIMKHPKKKIQTKREMTRDRSTLGCAFVYGSKAGVTTKIENENISRKQNYRTSQCCCLQTFMNSQGGQKCHFHF